MKIAHIYQFYVKILENVFQSLFRTILRIYNVILYFTGKFRLTNVDFKCNFNSDQNGMLERRRVANGELFIQENFVKNIKYKV